MAVRLDTDLRNDLATGLALTFPAAATLEIRTGTQPASANTAATGTLLATITLPADPWTAPASGTVSKQGTWTATAVATGTAGYGRLINVARAMDFSVGTVGTDWIIDNADIVTGGTVTVVTASITVPSGE